MVGSEGSLQLRDPRHTYHSVLCVVCLEESLQDLAGTQGVHVRVHQHQHVLETDKRLLPHTFCLARGMFKRVSVSVYNIYSYVRADSLVEVLLHSVYDHHLWRHGP